MVDRKKPGAADGRFWKLEGQFCSLFVLYHE